MLKATLLFLCPDPQLRLQWAADSFNPPDAVEFSKLGGVMHDKSFGLDCVLTRVCEALLVVDRLDDALAYADSAHVEQFLCPSVRIVHGIVRGTVHLARGEHEAASGALETAISKAAEQGLILFEIRAFEELAKLEQTTLHADGPSWQRLRDALRRTEGASQEQLAALLAPRDPRQGQSTLDVGRLVRELYD